MYACTGCKRIPTLAVRRHFCHTVNTEHVIQCTFEHKIELKMFHGWFSAFIAMPYGQLRLIILCMQMNNDHSEHRINFLISETNHSIIVIYSRNGMKIY